MVLIPVSYIVLVQIGVVPIPALLLQRPAGRRGALFLEWREVLQQWVLGRLAAQARSPRCGPSDSRTQLNTGAMVLVGAGAAGNQAADRAHRIQSGGGWRWCVDGR